MVWYSTSIINMKSSNSEIKVIRNMFVMRQSISCRQLDVTINSDEFWPLISSPNTNSFQFIFFIRSKK